jgi:hypothetical protein
MEGVLKEGWRETFKVATLVKILIAFISYTVARLLQTYALGKIAFLAKVPEISDLLVMVLGAGFTRGDTQDAVLVGSGLSLLNHLGERFGAGWLKVG